MNMDLSIRNVRPDDAEAVVRPLRRRGYDREIPGLILLTKEDQEMKMMLVAAERSEEARIGA